MSVESIQVFVLPQPDGTPSTPCPDRVLAGFVLVSAAALGTAERIDVQYRGVEVVGGTLDDFDDTDSVLIPRSGVRALSKVYFDERLELWRRGNALATHSAEACGSEEFRRLEFAIAVPRANYPAEIRSVCVAAPSQSFEIAYHVTALLYAPSSQRAPMVRSVRRVGFAPQLTQAASVGPQAPVTRTAYDDRGKECLVTRVTLSQADYVPGDQVVGGVFIECTKANRSIRRAECQLRQRVECRMRRTFGPADLAADGSAASSRPQSAQRTADAADSDILWTRVLDLGPWRPLTLTTVGVGLAAAAASASSQTSDCDAGSIPGYADAARGSSKAAAVASSIIAVPNRSCSANVHTDIPPATPLVPGHFLSFSYELLVAATVYSLTRGSQTLTTRTPLGSAPESTTPTGLSGLTLPRHYPHHVPAASAGGSMSATAACFPQSALISPGCSSLIDGREKAQLKGSRFSVGAFHGGVTRLSSGCIQPPPPPSLSLLPLPPPPPPLSLSLQAVASASQCSFTDECVQLPNAVELLRFRCDSTLALLPKLFIPDLAQAANADQDSNRSENDEEEDEAEEDEQSDLDVENAISQLAPTKRGTSSQSLLGNSPAVKDFIHSIDFFAGEGGCGPELTGMLSADPDKLVFGISALGGDHVVPGGYAADAKGAEQRTDREASSITTSATGVDDEVSAVPAAVATAVAIATATQHRPSWVHAEKQPLTGLLRRSISMPGGSGAIADTGSTVQNMYSPGSTVARSAFERGSKTLVRKQRNNKDEVNGGLGMSPRSFISAVSLSSPLGSSTRVGMFKTIGHRFTSWFGKK
ncbi:hypothetical protein H4R26_004139 [Coemansia thaxteri]|uniref:Uncharacterized protein n=1 Tax=Coemansia thaxteri TaxID=2663907 RepID=A0A9W8BB92_9FUNG|nr:hypothetical protein H4R26_004139 [Coemansia thaxteri]